MTRINTNKKKEFICVNSCNLWLKLTLRRRFFFLVFGTGVTCFYGAQRGGNKFVERSNKRRNIGRWSRYFLQADILKHGFECCCQLGTGFGYSGLITFGIALYHLLRCQFEVGLCINQLI